MVPGRTSQAWYFHTPVQMLASLHQCPYFCVRAVETNETAGSLCDKHQNLMYCNKLFSFLN